MNLGELKTHVANRTGNDYADSVFTDFVNQVQSDICSRYPFAWRLSLPVSVYTIANQNYLNPSAYLSNFGEPCDAVEHNTPRKLVYVDLWHLNLYDPHWTKGSDHVKGVPTKYSVDWPNERLWFYPTPDQAYQVTLRYYKDAPEITSTSSALFIPSKYHHVVAAGVESLAWQMDEDLQSANAANSRFEAGIERMIQEDVRKSDHQPVLNPGVGYIDYSDPFLDV